MMWWWNVTQCVLVLVVDTHMNAAHNASRCLNRWAAVSVILLLSCIQQIYIPINTVQCNISAKRLSFCLQREGFSIVSHNLTAQSRIRRRCLHPMCRQDKVAHFALLDFRRSIGSEYDKMQSLFATKVQYFNVLVGCFLAVMILPRPLIHSQGPWGTHKTLACFHDLLARTLLVFMAYSPQGPKMP